ncbi:hypothetical protein Btru_050474 [Bulinus truncatus]|nr:hypothetical protein Btru_050474 [Bulinus truncatus]
MNDTTYNQITGPTVDLSEPLISLQTYALWVEAPEGQVMVYGQDLGHRCVNDCGHLSGRSHSLSHNHLRHVNANGEMSNKDQEVLKTMIAITTVFLACQAVSHIPADVMSTVPGVSVDGYNRYIFNLIYFVRLVLEILNSSVHFFLYSKMRFDGAPWFDRSPVAHPEVRHSI